LNKNPCDENQTTGDHPCEDVIHQDAPTTGYVLGAIDDTWFYNIEKPE
jgi:hypothetical protein